MQGVKDICSVIKMQSQQDIFDFVCNQKRSEIHVLNKTTLVHLVVEYSNKEAADEPVFRKIFIFYITNQDQLMYYILQHVLILPDDATKKE